MKDLYNKCLKYITDLINTEKKQHEKAEELAVYLTTNILENNSLVNDYPYKIINSLYESLTNIYIVNSYEKFIKNKKQSNKHENYYKYIHNHNILIPDMEFNPEEEQLMGNQLQNE